MKTLLHPHDLIPVLNREHQQDLAGGAFFLLVKTLPPDPPIGSLSYKAQLEHPKWKAVSENFKEAAGYRCRNCGKCRPFVTLNVHHHYYTKRWFLWEYPDRLMMCLCKKCHEERHELEGELFIDLAMALNFISNEQLKGLQLWDILAAVGRAEGGSK